MTEVVPPGKIRLRFTEFVVDPSDPDVMRRVLNLDADLLTFEGSTVTFWQQGVEACSFPLYSLTAVELPPVVADAPLKAYSVEEVRKKHANAYQRWTEEDEQLLLELHRAGQGVDDLAQQFDRQPSAIRARLGRLGVEAPAVKSQQAKEPPF